ncbi:MAG: deoxyribonuclease V [Candidatus Poribacteria bacterium]|nr:deoxyribonuclease V [Candidatus Poribacteria bacterium]
MQYQNLHSWHVTTKEARQLQDKLRNKLIQKDQFTEIRTIAGVDVGHRNDIALASVVVLNYPDLQIVDGVVAESRVNFPYIPGYLSFREIPPLLVAFARLQTEPDLIIVDGQGIAHPRRFGLACHLGLILDVPTIGCAKSRLCGEYIEPDIEKGSFSHILDKDEIIGVALRTRTNVNVVYVSIGHRISLDSARIITMSCCPKYRLPETTRYAHKAASGEIPEKVIYVKEDG